MLRPPGVGVDTTHAAAGSSSHEGGEHAVMQIRARTDSVSLVWVDAGLSGYQLGFSMISISIDVKCLVVDDTLTARISQSRAWGVCPTIPILP